MLRKIVLCAVMIFSCGRILETESFAVNRNVTFDEELHSFLKLLQQSVRFVNACRCPQDESANDILDCTGMATSEWEPSTQLMPQKPSGFSYFYVKVGEGDSDASWCPTNRFVTRFATDLPITLDIEGNLRYNDNQQEEIIVNRTGYCLVRKQNQTMFKICKGELEPKPKPPTSNFVRKCCPSNQVMDGNRPHNCVNVTLETRWSPIYYRDGNKLRVQNDSFLEMIHGFPNCSSYIIQSFRDNKFPNLQENGDVILVNDRPGARRKYTRIQADELCIDGVYVNDNRESDQAYQYSGSEWHQAIIICVPKETEETQTIQKFSFCNSIWSKLRILFGC